MGSYRWLTTALAGSAVFSLAIALLAVARAQVYAPPPFRVQLAPEPEVTVGTLLYADRSLRDPNFAETVVLIVKYDEQGTLGLILNRRTDVPISRLLDDWKEAKGRVEPVFIGGPVEKSALLALIRSRKNSGSGSHVLPDVDLISDRDELQKQLQAGLRSDKLRIYVGYAGWSPEQLEDEVDAGAWHVLPGDPSLVFDSDPESLWGRLIKRSETQIAAVGIRKHAA